MDSGLFISFEGVDGTGKTTLSRRLASYVDVKTGSCVLVREPGGTPEAEKIRDLIVSHPSDYFDRAANALLFGACRAQVTNTVIRPALAGGKVVISDRYKASSIAYQHFGGGADLEMVMQMNALSSGGLNPNVTFLFLVGDEDKALELVLQRNGKKDARDSEGFDFYKRVERGYQEIAKGRGRPFQIPSRYVLLNPLEPLELTWKIIERTVNDILKEL